MNTESQTSKERTKPKTPLMELIVAALGAVIVATTLGFMTYEAVAGDHSQPLIRFAIRSITQSGEDYHVHLAAFNEGGKTASDVKVEAVLSGPNAETAEMTFDFLPPHSERRGGLFFKQKPTPEQLTFRATGYREP